MAGTDLTVCKDCSKEVSKSAKVCPHCGKKLKMGLWMKLVIGFVGLILIGAILGGGSDKKGTASTGQAAQAASATEAPKTAPSQQVIVVSATQMAKDYESNEIAADEKYKGKMIQITGVVDGIEKDLFDNPFLSMDTGWSGYFFHCSFEDATQLKKLKKGQKVTVVGEGDRLSLNFINLKDCQLR